MTVARTTTAGGTTTQRADRYVTCFHVEHSTMLLGFHTFPVPPVQDAPGRRVGSGRVLNRGEREDFDPRRFESAASSRRELLLPAGGAGGAGGGGEKYAFGRRDRARDDEMDSDPRMRLR